MLDVLHEMIDKVYEIGMVYGITVIIYLLEGYLLAGFAAQFGDMRCWINWKSCGMRKKRFGQGMKNVSGSWQI